MTGETLLFVYGSLMRGEENARELAGARWLGDARTAPAYTLVSLGRYPALVPGGGHQVAGELWAVDAPHLARLDSFEEHPDVYRRAPIRLGDGRTAQAYLMPVERADGAAPVASADWRRRS